MDADTDDEETPPRAAAVASQEGTKETNKRAAGEEWVDVGQDATGP
jgi:hypothetical protein